MQPRHFEDLYQRVVNQVKEQFGYYHTQLLRYDPTQEVIVLVTGYGETGERCWQKSTICRWARDLIGTAATTGETVLRPALQNDPDWRPNPILPDTKGEIAVPIKLGNTILGVLDVQSDPPALWAQTINFVGRFMRTNCCRDRKHPRKQEMTERLEEINRLYQAMSRRGLESISRKRNIPEGYMFDQSGVKQVQESQLAKELFHNLPLIVPGGEYHWEICHGRTIHNTLSPEDQDFLQQVSEQVSFAMESARLFEQTQEALSRPPRRVKRGSQKP